MGANLNEMWVFNMTTLRAYSALNSKNLRIQADELVAFCIDAYNNIEFLVTSHDEKSRIINLSVNSMLRGNNIILKKTVNL